MTYLVSLVHSNTYRQSSTRDLVMLWRGLHNADVSLSDSQQYGIVRGSVVGGAPAAVIVRPKIAPHERRSVRQNTMVDTLNCRKRILFITIAEYISQ